jgi:hypothetical protein
MWLAQAVANGRFPRPAAKLHPAVLHRFERAYDEAVNGRRKPSRAELDRWLMSDERHLLAGED